MITMLRGQDNTLTEWNKRVLRPVPKEPIWHELVWLLPIPRYDTSSELIPVIQSHSAYGCSAGQQREVQFPSQTAQRMSSFHRQRCSLSRSYPARRLSGCSTPITTTYCWLRNGTYSIKRTGGLCTGSKLGVVTRWNMNSQ
jgi:hypothetical protein